jgi:uncharacterized RDD family membrane protein YckC
MSSRVSDPTFTSYPVAPLERRFYAFVIDRLIGWGLVAAACWAAYELFFSDDRPWAGVALIVAAVALVWVLFAVALGSSGATPGKAVLGLRAVHFGLGSPIGVGRALLRGLVLGVATLPTLGIGLATLAWTAVMDPARQRRGWHDKVARSVVVDVRPEPVEAVEADSGPRHVVNLTAMRLVPASQPAVPQPERPQPTVPQPVLRRQPPVPAPPSPVQESGRTVRRGPVVVPSGPPPGPPSAAPVGWVLTFDTGQRVVVDGPLLVGRRPEARAGESVRLVALPSADLSLSKTHAQVTVAPDGALVVVDRGSTNGSLIIRQGTARPLSGGKPATLLEGDVVRLGDRSMQVGREG